MVWVGPSQSIKQLTELVSKKVAVGCLMAWIYYIVVGYLTGLLAVPKDDEEKPAKERKKIPTARRSAAPLQSHEQFPLTSVRIVHRHPAWQSPIFTNLTATASNRPAICQPEHQATVLRRPMIVDMPRKMHHRIMVYISFMHVVFSF